MRQLCTVCKQALLQVLADRLTCWSHACLLYLTCTATPSLQATARTERKNATADLRLLLPDQLLAKDVHSPQPDLADPEIVAEPVTEEQLLHSLEGLPWEFIITKDARQEWARMDPPFRSGLHQRRQHIHRCSASCLHESVRSVTSKLSMFKRNSSHKHVWYNTGSCVSFVIVQMQESARHVYVCAPLMQGDGAQEATAYRSRTLGAGWGNTTASVLCQVAQLLHLPGDNCRARLNNPCFVTLTLSGWQRKSARGTTCCSYFIFLFQKHSDTSPKSPHLTVTCFCCVLHCNEDIAIFSNQIRALGCMPLSSVQQNASMS